MRLKIRPEQMNAIETAAEAGFARRLAAHLRTNYGGASVRLPGEQNRSVAELPPETLDALVRRSIVRARSYGLSHESAIAAFSAVMFEVAPNFDTHKLSQVLLNDEETEPNARLDQLLEVLTEKNWESIKGTYDPAAWELKNDAQPDEKSEREGEE